METLYLKSTKKSLSTDNLLVNRKLQLLKKAQEILKEKENSEKPAIYHKKPEEISLENFKKTSLLSFLPHFITFYHILS